MLGLCDDEFFHTIEVWFFDLQADWKKFNFYTYE